MPSRYQQETLQALLGLFLEAKGQALPAHSLVKSASAISRFLKRTLANATSKPNLCFIRLMFKRLVAYS